MCLNLSYLSILVDGVIAGKCCATFNSQFYRPQTKYAKVYIFTDVCPSTGGSVWNGRGLCMAGGIRGKGHACQRVCMAGGMRGKGACMSEGMHGGGHAWQSTCVTGGYMAGVCLAGGVHGRGHAWQERWPLQRAVCILIECILVCSRQGSFKCCRLFANKLLLALGNIGLKIYGCFPMTFTINRAMIYHRTTTIEGF